MRLARSIPLLFLATCALAQLSLGGHSQFGGQLVLQGKPRVTITTSSLPNAIEGVSYSQTLAAINGTTPYTWTVQSGALPPGLSLNSSTGAVTGTPTTTGSYPFIIRVTDSSGPPQHSDQSFGISVNCAPLGILTTFLPDGTQNIAYQQQMQSQGGTGAITWLVTGGALPTGLALSSGGLISGTPTTAQLTNPIIQATDSCFATPQQTSSSFSLNIAAPVTITTPTTLPPATESQAYSVQFAASGGTSPYTWTQTAGTLPIGLTFSSAGLLTGVATTTGTFTFTVQVQDSGAVHTTSAVFTVIVSCAPLTIVTDNLPGATQGSSYSAQLTSTGGTGAVSWSVADNTLPQGVLLSSAGLLSGTPTVTGSFPLLLQATDSCVPTAQQQSVSLTLVVVSSLSIATSSPLPGGVEGQGYSAKMQATGGTTPYTWTLLSGTLPVGLILAADGTISGTPTQTGTFNSTIGVADSASQTAQGTFQIQINCTTLSITSTSPLPAATQNSPYSFQLQASGGTGGLTWALSGGTLPAGLTLSASGLISGTPSVSGVFSPVALVQDSCSPSVQQVSKTFSLTVVNQLAITTTSPLPSGTEGQSYSAQMSAVGGTPPYTWALSSGSLPTGLALSFGGVISGTPTAAGTKIVTIQVTDSAARTVSGPFSITINCVPLSISTVSPLPAGTQNVAYSLQLTSSGGNGAVAWSVTAGTLPAGITLSSSGLLSGTPTQTGTFTPTIQARDSCSPAPQSVTKAFSLTINPAVVPITIVTTSPLPGATESVAYSFQMQASGGTPPYTWSITVGSLPAGLSLSAGGAITGTPTSAGTVTPTIKVVDNVAANTSGVFSITVSCTPLSLTTTSPLPNATQSQSYSQQMLSSGGTGAVTWSITAGALPTGLTLSSAGLISGTPSVSGTFTPTIRATDSCSPTPQTAQNAFTLTVIPVLAILTTSPLPAATESVAYSVTLSATGGVPPYTWALTAGALPAGLTLSAGGVISGTPTSAGTTTPTIRVTDSAATSTSKVFSITVSCTPLAISTASPLPSGTQGTAYSQQLQFTGGTGLVTWALTGGTLPTGVSVSSSGLISGSPSVNGAFSPQFTATDSCSPTPQTSVKTFSLTIASNVAPLVITTTSPLPTGTQGTAYSAQMSATGGVTPYTWSILAGSLPSGVVIGASGLISGTPTQAGTFAVTIQVQDSAATTKSGVFNLTINCAPLSITTTSPLPAGTISIAYSFQMQSAGGTGALTWSLSSGSFPTGVSISSGGLISGTPSGSGTFTPVIKVVDSCSPAQTATGSFSLTINTAPLTITTASPLPNATQNQVYTTTFSASGGATPYTWTVSAGSLPTGLSLSGAGVLSGTPSGTGTSSFTIQVQDAGAVHTATKVFSLTVVAVQPNLYPSACTNLTTIQLPSPLPNWGNLVGANVLIKDPEPSNGTTCFHNPIVRVTDAKTNNAGNNVTYGIGTGGSGDENIWNTNSTLLIVGDTGGSHFPFSFNTTTMQAARLYATSTQGSGMTITPGGSWSFTNSQVFYALNVTTGTGGLARIEKYDFTNRVTQPTPTVVVNFKAGGNALAANYNAQWSVAGLNSKDDLTFAAAFSGTGSQNTGCDVVVWRSSGGFSHLNTCTGSVTGDSGGTGTVGIADRFTIHNMKLNKDGTRAIITPGTCQTTCNNNQSPYEWTAYSTTLAYLAPVGTPGGGHFTEGYTHWINASGTGFGNYTIRTFATPSTTTQVPIVEPPGLVPPLDNHLGWSNVNAGDTLPFLLTNTSATSPFPSAWYNEVQAIDPTVGTVWRFAHTYNNMKSHRFETQIAAGSVSQDGNFLAFSSDIIGTLGSEAGATSCTEGTNCRGDVFVVALNPPVFSHFVTLTWTASTTAGVTYNVKRSTTSGGPYTIVGSGISALTFNDNTVSNSTTYFYIATATLNGVESVPSNQATAAVGP